MAFRILTLLLAITTIPVAANAQAPCYRPDGSMYVGVQPPADCSSTRPKARDEAIQKSLEERARHPAERQAVEPEAAPLKPGQGWTFKVYKAKYFMKDGVEYVKDGEAARRYHHTKREALRGLPATDSPSQANQRLSDTRA
jgi:hypothetical protein